MAGNSITGSTGRRILALLAFIAGGAVPIQLVTLSFGYAEYLQGVTKMPEVIRVAHQFAAWYIPFIYVPAMVILIGIASYSRRRYPGLCRRIVVGFSCGAICTLSLDAIRQMGVIHDWLPGDTIVMFGKMATGSATFSIYWPAGIAVHYLNGANFGLFYAFVWGKRRSHLRAVLWATTWALVLETLMMVAPPMGPMVGLFGVQYAWPQLFLLTFVAHIFSGFRSGF